jgi:hypothetical protein
MTCTGSVAAPSPQDNIIGKVSPSVTLLFCYSIKYRKQFGNIGSK